ncbi:hypothetical protein C7974DRAFT_454494 [Boeremia exigua]|uniref:uncharacterized protein n=1 Tax=Boeremia exigua TaxID=749465 RepID=UPI001E8EE87F|nr:uncharacterized protein C7974DRAFT_454494 [Boeremia exigua]KAH6629652.1 hypothetical protein C7974DRAFT_454494 [Boeremia exigua]
MSHSWLQKKRKGELLELAQTAKLADADGLLKDDLVLALEGHLNSNETTYAKHPNFKDYYSRGGSPVKREYSSPEPLATVKSTRRSTLTVKSASQSLAQTTQDVTQSIAKQTPRALPRRVSQIGNEIDLPASPSQLAEVADQSFQAAKTKASELWEKTRVDEIKEAIRENVSSVAAIQTLILLIEAAGLQFNTLQTTPAFAIDADNSHYLHIPDFWTLLTSEWWAPATMWSLTSWVLPFVLSYFFNLTLRSNTNHKSSYRQYPADPLVFNIVKAILAYSAYRLPLIDASLVGEAGLAKTISLNWGPFSEQTVGVVRNNVPGGYQGLQIGAVVGVLVSLYDAALKK